jgi:hypothetical protein
VSSAGYDVNGTSDQFTFVYTTAKGDVSLVAKIASLQNTDPWSQVGLMIRESVAANSLQASVLETAANGVVFRNRSTSRGGTSQTMGGGGVAPVWLRIDRKSATLTAFRSVDGVNWIAVSNIKLKLNQNVLVGFAVASHSTSMSVAASLSTVTLNGAPVPAAALPPPPANVAPTVSLTSPGNGAAFAAPAVISLAATATDSDGSVAKVDFYNGATLLGSDSTSPYTFTWNNVAAGTYALTAKATDNTGAIATSSTVSVTVNANTPPAVSLTSPISGTSFMAPASTTVTANATDANGIARVDFYAGATLLGTDTTSPYSVAWNNVAAGTYVLTAKATDNAGVSTVSAGVSVTVKTNQAPTVSLTSPTSGATFPAPASIGLTASATDVDGTIQKVEFYNGATLLGASTTSPYAFTWPNVPAGSYSVGAAATDNLGAKTVSAWVDFTVGATSTLSKAIFTPAVVPDAVSYYVFEVFPSTADPNTAAPTASQNLGLPAVVNGEITVDVATTISNLASGNYIATVSSVSSGEGTLRSPSFAFTR